MTLLPFSLRTLVLACATGLSLLELLGLILHIACPSICLRSRAVPLQIYGLNVTLEVGLQAQLFAGAIPRMINSHVENYTDTIRYHNFI